MPVFKHHHFVDKDRVSWPTIRRQAWTVWSTWAYATDALSFYHDVVDISERLVRDRRQARQSALIAESSSPLKIQFGISLKRQEFEFVRIKSWFEQPRACAFPVSDRDCPRGCDRKCWSWKAGYALGRLKKLSECRAHTTWSFGHWPSEFWSRCESKSLSIGCRS